MGPPISKGGTSPSLLRQLEARPSSTTTACGATLEARCQIFEGTPCTTACLGLKGKQNAHPNGKVRWRLVRLALAKNKPGVPTWFAEESFFWNNCYAICFSSLVCLGCDVKIGQTHVAVKGMT